MDNSQLTTNSLEFITTRHLSFDSTLDSSQFDFQLTSADEFVFLP